MDHVTEYFLAGYSYNEILTTLVLVHGVHISKRQLHRKLRSLGLYRRRNDDDINSLLHAINVELQGSGSDFGYRLMHQKLRLKGYTIDRESVRMALKILDPEGVEARTSHRFRRRKYISKGPNYTWHIDGYDKLKPFGFAIHGGIDGYSRKILWLNVAATNNDPKVIGSYYLKTVKNLHIIPSCIRCDRGTENIVVGGIQRYFRRNNLDRHSGHLSFRYGPSTRNQRIEAWWSIFRKNRANWWINFFKDLCENTPFDPSINFHVECLRYCFMGLIQSELDETTKLWNNHRIRKSRNSECPPGRPNVLFFSPEIHDSNSYGLPLLDNEYEIAKNFVEEPNLFGCTYEVAELVTIIAFENNIDTIENIFMAKYLFSLCIQELL